MTLENTNICFYLKPENDSNFEKWKKSRKVVSGYISHVCNDNI